MEIVCAQKKREHAVTQYTFKIEYERTGTVEIVCPLAGEVDLPCRLGPGGGKQVRVGLGHLGGRVVTGQQVQVLQPRAACVSLGGARQRCRVGQLGRFGGRAGEFLPGRVHQVGPGGQRRTPVVVFLPRTTGWTVSNSVSATYVSKTPSQPCQWVCEAAQRCFER